MTDAARHLPLRDAAFAMRAARLAAGDDAGALAWVERVLAGHLRRSRTIPLPERAAAELSACRSGGSEAEALIVDCVPLLAAERLSPGRVVRRCVPSTVVRLAESERAARCGVEGRRGKWLRRRFGAEVRSSPAVRSWSMPGPGFLVADVDIGPARLDVSFHGARGRWTRCGVPRGVLSEHPRLRSGTGSFASIDLALRHVTAEFLVMSGARSLTILGADAVRNRHNAAVYPGCVPEGWGVREIVEEGHPRADVRGVVGIVVEVVSHEVALRGADELRRLVASTRRGVVLPPLEASGPAEEPGGVLSPRDGMAP